MNQNNHNPPPLPHTPLILTLSSPIKRAQALRPEIKSTHPPRCNHNLQHSNISSIKHTQLLAFLLEIKHNGLTSSLLLLINHFFLLSNTSHSLLNNNNPLGMNLRLSDNLPLLPGIEILCTIKLHFVRIKINSRRDRLSPQIESPVRMRSSLQEIQKI